MRFRRHSLVSVFLPSFAALLLVGGAGYLAVRPQVGPQQNGSSHLVATQQVIRPAGDVLPLPGSRPVDLALAPDNRTLYVKDNRGVLHIDTATWKERQSVLKFPKGGGSMHGIAVSPDGKRVFATNSDNLLCEATPGADGTLTWTRQISLPGPEGKGASYPCGIALSPDGKTAYVCLSRNNSLAVVDLVNGKLVREIPVGVAPFDVVLAKGTQKAYVSNWGGRRPKSGELSAPSSGTATLIDKRGVAASGTVSVLDLAGEGKEVQQIPAGLHSSDLALSPDGRTLAVANANADTVSLIDTAVNNVRETVVVRPDTALPFGSMPNALAFAPDNRTLYVANGGNNAVAVLAIGSTGTKSRLAGHIPAGWYPGALALGGDRLFVASIKGLGSRSKDADDTDQKGWNVYSYTGTLQRLTLPLSGEALARYTRQVRADGRLPEILRTRERMRSGRKPVPVPERPGEPSVFEHVVYVIKENRTYDQVFGDLAQGNGDKSLCIYGREITPNHHALAEEFVLLDNFYCNGVLSADGHSWVTEGNVTDHLEKAFGGFTRSYTFGDDPLTYSSSGFIWDNALARGLSVRNYGEMDYTNESPDVSYAAIWKDWQEKAGKVTFKHNIGIENLKRYSSPDAPGWNMDIPDRIRADVFLRDLADWERKDEPMPNLTLIYLPNDHTTGSTPGDPTPSAYLGDNDLALGRIVEGISRSRYWPKTCVFVIEDDPQDGFDHVDGHRSLCLVVSPYTRRGAVVSSFYNQTSVLHTMERMLGLQPMNQMDAMSPLMRECFTATPNLQPYVCKPVSEAQLTAVNPPKTALTGLMRQLAVHSEQQPFERFDAADEDTLNRILWHNAKGANAPYPAHLAGAHGRGLQALGLKAGASEAEEEEDEEEEEND